MRMFSSRNVMKRHYVTVHTGERPYSCWFCKYATNRYHSLKEHCVRVHEMEPEDFKAKAKGAFKKIKFTAN